MGGACDAEGCSDWLPFLASGGCVQHWQSRRDPLLTCASWSYWWPFPCVVMVRATWWRCSSMKFITILSTFRDSLLLLVAGSTTDPDETHQSSGNRLELCFGAQYIVSSEKEEAHIQEGASSGHWMCSCQPALSVLSQADQLFAQGGVRDSKWDVRGWVYWSSEDEVYEKSCYIQNGIHGKIPSRKHMLTKKMTKAHFIFAKNVGI